MTQQELFDLTMKEARAIGHASAQMAADHAGETWKDLAFAAFLKHARYGLKFTTEDVRKANPDLPEPPDVRAWGAVAKRAQREGFVRACGAVPVKSSRGGYKTQWVLA